MMQVHLFKSSTAILLLVSVLIELAVYSGTQAIPSVTTATSCSRTPTRLPHSRRSRGDNGYRLIVADSDVGYVPGKTYNVLLLGSRTHEKVQHFTHFTITAEAHSGGRRSQPANPKRVGRFQLFSDGISKFNEICVNTVLEKDDLPKTEVQVMWVAPETGSGCVSLAAMVYENQRTWYSDDNQLTQVICEKKIHAKTVKEECCACDEAKYNFVFEGIWSNETHPKDYPFAVWLTHFSDVVGASHEANFTFWGENHIATDGFRSLAEWGSPGPLEAELRTKGPRLRTLIKAAGLWYPNVNTNTSGKFRVDRKHPEVSMVSMFGPSPDWVVGISGVDLCTKQCSWKESLEFDLYPWDAGTDGGISYMSPNSETIPRERMYRITNMYPEDPRAPFYNPLNNEVIPLAKLYLTREKIISRSCDDDFLEAIKLEVSDDAEEQDTRVECRVTDYTEWSPCSVTCGKGLRMRTRQYINPENADALKCNKQLVSKEMCLSAVEECKSSRDEDDEGENLANTQSLVRENGEGAGICKTTPWRPWSECSASCGIGITMRTRTFVNHLGRKHCPHISVVEKQKCMRPECKFEDVELPDPLCPVTQWSDWSPCSVTCGTGVIVRSRLLLLEDEEALKMCQKRIELSQQKPCSLTNDCTINHDMAKDICSETVDRGPCRAYFMRYAFDMESGRCKAFMYGGCRGNRNNFLNEEDCVNTCKSFNANTAVYYDKLYNATDDDTVPEGCQMSEWTNWSKCNVRCGIGYSERYRYVISQNANLGKECSERLVKRRRCTMTNCYESREKLEQNEAQKAEEEAKDDPELDISSELFNAQRALNLSDFRVAKRLPKMHFQNLASFESALGRVGLWELNKKPSKTPSVSQPVIAQNEAENVTQRRFLPHQMAIRTERVESDRHNRTVFTYMENIEGPLQKLKHWRTTQERICVVLRNERGIRGTLCGQLIAFDKQWNLMLKNVVEVWQRRKYKYGANNLCGTKAPEDCTRHLQELGIALPITEVKSLNRKNVQITRRIRQILVRGEQIVLVRTEIQPTKVETIK